jgi:hypothetical protein
MDNKTKENQTSSCQDMYVADADGFDNLNQRLWTEMSEKELLELLQGSVCMYGKKGGSRV